LVFTSGIYTNIMCKSFNIYVYLTCADAYASEHEMHPKLRQKSQDKAVA